MNYINSVDVRAHKITTCAHGVSRNAEEGCSAGIVHNVPFYFAFVFMQWIIQLNGLFVTTNNIQQHAKSGPIEWILPMTLCNSSLMS